MSDQPGANPPEFQSDQKGSRFTRREVVVALALFTILVTLGVWCFQTLWVPAAMANQLQNGRSIYMAMRSYSAETAHGGRFPLYRKDGNFALVANSDEAFEVLLVRYIDDKRVFWNKGSAYHEWHIQTAANRHKLLSGESDWAYVRGLGETSSGDWPLLANAFAPNTTTYVKDPERLGGVWGGERAVVIYANGTGKVVKTKEGPGGYFVPRRDKPAANAFEPDGAWLAEPDVKVLNPKWR